MHCFFVTDLHGRPERYDALTRVTERERPAAIFLGGDLLASHLQRLTEPERAVARGGHLVARFEQMREALGPAYPQVFLILGNDDPATEEGAILDAEARGLWTYGHRRRVRWGEHEVLGYNCVPPTPFLLKDWERYDVSRYVDPGCVSPEEGRRTVDVPPAEIRHGTIAGDLAALAVGAEMDRAICLFHSPPYQTSLDRASLDGQVVDHVPRDVHVGSVAVRRFIESRRPRLALHGHVHEAARLTGVWRERLGTTWILSAAHDGPELALVRFDPRRIEDATRDLV